MSGPAAIGERRRQAPSRPRLNVRALAVYFVLAYALSWAWVFPLAADHLRVVRGAGWPTHYPALFGPTVAAMLVTAWTMRRAGIRDLLARVVRCRSRCPGGWRPSVLPPSWDLR